MKDLRETSCYTSRDIPLFKAHFRQEEEEDALLFEAYAADVLIKDCKYQAVFSRRSGTTG